MGKLEDLLRKVLKSTKMESYGRAGGGCINEGEGFMTDSGPVFVKKNRKSEARRMFDGEYESLKALYSTNTIRVPKPISVIDDPSGGALFVAEYLDMGGKGNRSAELGTKLARLHLHNSELMKKESDRASWVKPPDDFEPLEPVTKFGFHCTTCCGFIPQDNTWCDDWVKFYTERKLKPQIEMLMKEYNDRELGELWPQLIHKIPALFKDCGTIIPALLHGDLWGGNVSETDKEPVIFDPASFYGHSEFEFGIATIFGGHTNKQFYDAYHALIPKAPGFEKRLPLYQLFHYLNHWNHFGTGYRGSSISIMRKLCKS